MKKSWNAFALLVMLALVAGCSTTRTTGSTADSVCLIWTPAEYAAKEGAVETADNQLDTPETVAGNRALNAKRDSFCK